MNTDDKFNKLDKFFVVVVVVALVYNVFFWRETVETARWGYNYFFGDSEANNPNESSGMSSPQQSLGSNVMRITDTPSQFCDKGFIQIGETKFSYSDLKVEGADAILELSRASRASGIDVVAYGYMRAIRIGNSQDDRSDAEIGDGDQCHFRIGEVSTDLQTNLEVVFSPKGGIELGGSIEADEYRDVRRNLLRARDGKALVKVTGSIYDYYNNPKIYINAKSFEIIAEGTN